MVPHRGLLKTLRVFIQGFVDLFFTQVVMLVSERAAADGIGIFLDLSQRSDHEKRVELMRSWPMPVCRSGRITDDHCHGPTFPEPSSDRRSHRILSTRQLSLGFWGGL